MDWMRRSDFRSRNGRETLLEILKRLGWGEKNSHHARLRTRKGAGVSTAPRSLMGVVGEPQANGTRFCVNATLSRTTNPVDSGGEGRGEEERFKEAALPARLV